jgi:spore germination cell wall hydrolase CwlJ-like protein
MIEFAAICLAANIYFEARSEPEAGQIAVAQVTMKRAKNNTDKVCEVVLEKKQFSWLNGKTKKNNSVILAAFEKPTDKKAWAKSRKIADLVLSRKFWDHSNGATHYHTKKVNPKWSKSKNMKLVTVIGDHRFYKLT